MKRSTVSHVCSTAMVILAFAALLLPIVTPGLNPGLVGAQAFHGHVTVNGVVEPHTHSITSFDDGEIVFTSDDAGSASSSLAIIHPPANGVLPIGTLSAEHARGVLGDPQWSPEIPLSPPRLSA